MLGAVITVRATTAKFVVMVVLVSVAAGCVGGGANSTAQSVDPTSSVTLEEGQAAVSGLVINDQLAPLAGAMLQLDELPPVTTDEGGAFTVAPVDPGDHTLTVQALGYQSMARRISVPAEGLAGVQFMLSPIPVEHPYTEVAILDGYSICDMSVLLLVTTIDGYIGSCPIGEPKRVVEMDIADSWRYGVLEMYWATQDSFAFYASKDGNCLTNDPCWGAIMGQAPLKIFAAPQDPELAKRFRLTTSGDGAMYPAEAFHMIITALYAGMFQKEMNQTLGSYCMNEVDFYIGCPGLGTTLGIRFTYYVSIFHYAKPDQAESYSAVPDQ